MGLLIDVLINDGRQRREEGVGIVQHRKRVTAELIQRNAKTLVVRIGTRIVTRRIARDLPR